MPYKTCIHKQDLHILVTTLCIPLINYLARRGIIQCKGNPLATTKAMIALVVSILGIGIITLHSLCHTFTHSP